MTLLADLVATSRQVAATSSRSAKVSTLAELLRRLGPGEVAPAVAMLSGEPRQGRFGVGWRRLADLEIEPAAEPSLTVGEVDRALDRLALTTGTGSVAARNRELEDLFARATAAEGEFLFQLLTGGLRQGALEGIMVDAVAKAAGVPVATLRRAVMLAGDLCATAALALDPGGGQPALAAVGLQPMRPVLPMLAASSPTVADALATTGRASVEWKLDGARIQLHRDGDDVGIYTRNLNDVTGRLPGIVALARALPARTFILDGEALGWSEDGDRPDRFQEIMSRFGSLVASSLAARFFDCLHVDGRDLLDEPLTTRLDVLEQLAGVWRVPAILTEDPDEAAAFSDDALAAGHEGVMVKAAGSLYAAGRRGGSWRKVKPVETFDLIVIGAEWGHGRRKGWLSNLHLGARDPSGGPPVMVGKTFKGLTDELLTWQTAALLARETHREGITVFVRPELVVEIALDGVQSSTRYPGGLALRFARVKRYRPDKSPSEADTLGSLQALLRRDR
ncbi:MAG: ATP-dependent DNA ligase [Acidimicrobiia bacterium]